MSKNLDDVLRAGAAQVASVTIPMPAHLVRARGDRRQRRRAAAGAALAVAVIAGGAVASAAVGNHSHPAIAGHRSSLGLVAPTAYAPGVPNPVSFTIRNPGRARTVTVELNLGRPRYVVYLKAVVERLDRATGRWVSVPVVSRPSGWSASYTVHARPGSTVQHVHIVPAIPHRASSPAETLQVTILSGSRVLARQRAPAARLTPPTGTWHPQDDISVPLGHTSELDFTVHNPASVGYRMRLFLFAFLCPNTVSTCDRPPAGEEYQWFDGTAWQPLGASAYAMPGDGQLLETVLVPAHGQLTVKIRVIAGHAPPSTGQLGFTMTPDRASFPGPERRYTPVSSDSDSGFVMTASSDPGPAGAGTSACAGQSAVQAILSAWTRTGPGGSPMRCATAALTLTWPEPESASSGCACRCLPGAKPNGTPTGRPALRPR